MTDRQTDRQTDIQTERERQMERRREVIDPTDYQPKEWRKRIGNINRIESNACSLVENSMKCNVYSLTSVFFL